LPDESGPRPNEILHDEPLSRGSNRQNAPDPGTLQSWGRADRTRLFLWAGIAFLPTLGFGFISHLAGMRSDSILAVQSELPVRIVMVFFVVLATWIMSRVEKRLLAAYGIPLREAFRGRFWEGSVWGFATLSAILLILRASGHFRIDTVALTGMAVLRWGLAWGATFLAVSLSEELAFRGYWLFSMARRMGFWPAGLFLSAVFGVAHLRNHGENVLGIVQVVATGLLFCLMIRRTGNLWFAIGFHAAWDWAETFFYGTPDSGLLGVGRFLNSTVQGPNWLTGGSAGPEGSIFALVVLAACALLIQVRFPKANYPDRPV
jgi:membrane protease YdiL (CAAX protease family)